MYNLIAFDLDDTLSPAKSPADKEMINLLSQLLRKYKVAIITGGKFETINMQIISQFEDDIFLHNLYILPTIGTRMYQYKDKKWELVYKEDLSEKNVDYIKKVLEKAIEDLNLKPEKIWGEIIENRGSQVTYSALGQKALLEEKRKFDPDKKKRLKIVEYIKYDLKDFSIGIGGTTSIDITKKGLDKSYGIKKILKELNLKKEDLLFMGDAIFPGGNDYPVKKVGIDTKQVLSPEDTKVFIKELI